MSENEGKKKKLAQTQTIAIDQKAKKLLRLVKVSARLARDRERYREALRALVKTVPRETRVIIAKYTAALNRAIKDPSPENIRVLGELAVQKQQELRSWRTENREKREIVSKIAKQFYATLSEVAKISSELEEEFKEELAGVE
jgi:Xaa-Pro aminopeptidase